MIYFGLLPETAVPGVGHADFSTRKHRSEVTIPNVKDAVNVFDRTNCLVDGLSVPAALQAPSSILLS
jgi:hypothetical protein